MSNKNPIPVAVIGAGNMGKNHIRVYDEMDSAQLVEVVEPNPDIANKIDSKYDVSVLEDVSKIDQAEAATIAAPNNKHFSIAQTCIADLGIDILVEKPLDITVERAQTIVELAQDHGTILQVGHIERYNPAIQLLNKVIKQEEIFAIEAHRLGPFHDHLSHQDVIFDLMIHDVDVILSLVDASIQEIGAFGIAPRSDTCDHATAQLRFKNDVLGTATASHITHGKIRELTVTTADSYITLDYQDQSLVLQRRGIERTTELPSHSGYRTETITETPYVRTREPLKVELESFIKCVQDRSSPLVDGETGLKTIKLVSEISKEVM